MSILSDKLLYFVNQKKQNIAGLARETGIERSTLYQYLKGRRPLQNRAQLELLMSHLHLTPDERAEVLEAYTIARIGEKNYNRRRKVREILESLLTVEERKGASPQPEGKWPPVETGQSRLIQGELEVSRAVSQVLRETAAHGGELKLLVQPDYDQWLESLMLVGDGAGEVRVTQLICLEADSGPDGCSNLESIRRILRCGIGIRCYEPRYFYGKSQEHYGVMNVLPYLAVTEHYAMQISADKKAAFLHRDPGAIAYLGSLFENMRRQSFPLMVSLDGFGGSQAQWGTEYLKTADFSHTMEMSSGLCSVQFWDERLIRKYMNRNLPGYETMIENYIAYTAGLYRAKRQGQVTVLMNLSFVEEFIRTGVFREYPAVFFAEPMSPEDRWELIRRILKAVEEGWYHIRMVPAEEFSLNDHWEILVHRGSSMLFQYVFRNQFRIFRFEEKDILEAVYDYLESAAVGENVLDDSQSAALLRQWGEQYLGQKEIL